MLQVETAVVAPLVRRERGEKVDDPDLTAALDGPENKDLREPAAVQDCREHGARLDWPDKQANKENPARLDDLDLLDLMDAPEQQASAEHPAQLAALESPEPEERPDRLDRPEALDVPEKEDREEHQDNLVQPVGLERLELVVKQVRQVIKLESDGVGLYNMYGCFYYGANGRIQ